VGLKHRMKYDPAIATAYFNRIRVGLKHFLLCFSLKRYFILIESEWD